MKKMLFFILIILFWSCNKGEDSFTDLNKNNQTFSAEIKEENESIFYVSKKEALETVNDLLESIDNSNGMRSASREKNKREVEEIISFKNKTRATGLNSITSQIDKRFYIVNFKDNRGFALVSKDKRTFPVFAILDQGKFNSSSFENEENKSLIENSSKYWELEVECFNKQIIEEYSKQNSLRSKKDDIYKNSESAISDFIKDGWRQTRKVNPRLTTKWKQTCNNPSLTILKEGAKYNSIYNTSSMRAIPLEETDVFGCTPVAFGQVLYALRNAPGVNKLKYTNGESVLWNNMSKYSNEVKEVQRFLGWITANGKPGFYKEGTLVYNRDLRKFVDEILGNYLSTFYDNCTVADGDFDGYGWSEDEKHVSKELFSSDDCYVVMTAARGTFRYLTYHSFVIDGVVEFKKRIKGSGFLGTGWLKKWRNGVRHLYHVNAGWSGICNGYYLYVQNVGNKFEYTGTNNSMNYRSNVGYTIIKPK